MSLGAHTYWGVYLGRGNGNYRAAIAGLEMRATVGGPNLCVGGTPTSEGDGFPGNAFDGNPSTWWEGLQDRLPLRTPRIAYQFASPVEVAELVLVNNSNSVMLSAWGVLAWSDNGADWTLVAPAFGLSPDVSGSVTVSGFYEEASAASATGDGSAVLFGDWAVAAPDAPGARPAGGVANADIHGGQCRVSGDVAIDVAGDAPDTPVRRRVRLLDQASGALMRETWSDASTGAYTFDHVRPGAVIVMTEDHTGVYNAVVSDAVQPVPM